MGWQWPNPLTFQLLRKVHWDCQKYCPFRAFCCPPELLTYLLHLNKQQSDLHAIRATGTAKFLTRCYDGSFRFGLIMKRTSVFGHSFLFQYGCLSDKILSMWFQAGKHLTDKTVACQSTKLTGNVESNVCMMKRGSLNNTNSILTATINTTVTAT